MIYTLTLNPAIDLFIELDDLKSNFVNRSNYDELQANGKGINISLILDMLNIETVALGYSAGFTGKFIKDSLNEKSIENNFIDVFGTTRVNVFTQVKKTESEYKMVNKGPYINTDKQQDILTTLDKLSEGDILTINGSFPQGIDPSFLIKIAEKAEKNSFDLIIDTSYKTVLDILKNKPLLLKPNIDELSSWYGEELNSMSETLPYINDLLNKGAQAVLLSLGERGAVYMDNENTYFANAPTGNVLNTACSGDTLLGTFMGYVLHGYAKDVALKYAVSAGSSTAFRYGLTDFNDVDNLSKQVTVEKIRKDEKYGAI